jgi:serine phosphatase RsbU (regulator of sigma subunit)
MSGRSILSRLMPGFIRRSFRAKLIVAFLLVGVGASVDFAFVSGWLTWREATTEAKSLMYATVVQMAEALDGEAINALNESENVRADPRFDQARTQLVNMRDAIVRALDEASDANLADKAVVDLYVLGRTDDPGIGRLIVTYREEEAGRPYDMSRFPMMMKGWEVPTVEDEVGTDEYGTTLSAYAPIRDDSGAVVAIVGLDVDGFYFQMVIEAALVVAVGAFVYGVVLSLLFAWVLPKVMLRSFARLSVGMEHVKRGDLSCQVNGLASGDEFDRLIARFNEMVRGLRDHQEIKRDLEHAAAIQGGLLPQDAPEVTGFDIAGGIRYSHETGGDYFDYIDLSSNGLERWGVVVGDVTGHGVASALMMCSSRAVLRAAAREAGTDVSSLMQAVNVHLVHDSPTGAFMTAFYGVLDASDRRFIWCNAGHEPGILLHRARETVEHLGSGDIPLGIALDRKFPVGGTLQFEDGDVLVIGTDGISQARNPDGDFFGFDRMAEVLRGYRDASAREISNALHRAAQVHEGAEHLEDDATLVVIKCRA